MTYVIYHIPGKKIGVTNNVKYRVEEQQGYDETEYEILEMSDDINYVSYKEIELQKKYGYKIDEKLYKQLKCNQMNINVTEQTTTFPCPVNKLKGRLMDNKGMAWETDYGSCIITDESITWIMKNVVTSKYNDKRCYVYNKAFARWFDNNDAYPRTGAIATDHQYEDSSRFDLIRDWAEKRGLYDKGDVKTQALKLVEEVGETCRAILKGNTESAVDGIGDCVVVLTNLAELLDFSIEDCIDAAYDEIKDRTGKMSNGTFKKD